MDMNLPFDGNRRCFFQSMPSEAHWYQHRNAPPVRHHRPGTEVPKSAILQNRGMKTCGDCFYQQRAVRLGPCESSPTKRHGSRPTFPKLCTRQEYTRVCALPQLQTVEMSRSPTWRLHESRFWKVTRGWCNVTKIGGFRAGNTHWLARRDLGRASVSL